MNAESQWDGLNQRYGWGNTVPQYMLLDHKGYLVADKYEIERFDGGLEGLVVELLGDSTFPASTQSVDSDNVEFH